MAEQWQDKCRAGIHSFSIPSPDGTKECLWCGHTVTISRPTQGVSPPRSDAPEVGEG